jgi:hypothetical protein
LVGQISENSGQYSGHTTSLVDLGNNRQEKGKYLDYDDQDNDIAYIVVAQYMWPMIVAYMGDEIFLEPEYHIHIIH